MKLDILKKNKHKYNNYLYLGLPFEMQLLEAIKYGQNRFRLFNQARWKRKRIDAIRNRISDFDRGRISQPKTQ